MTRKSYSFIQIILSRASDKFFIMIMSDSIQTYKVYENVLHYTFKKLYELSMNYIQRLFSWNIYICSSATTD